MFNIQIDVGMLTYSIWYPWACITPKRPQGKRRRPIEAAEHACGPQIGCYSSVHCDAFHC